jgi:DNA-binding beta-propeller fold protein YncE
MDIQIKGFRRPYAIAFSNDGNIYCLCDGMEKSIVIISKDGKSKSIKISDLGLLNVLTLVTNNNNQIIILDDRNNTLNWFDLNLNLIRKLDLVDKKYGALYYHGLTDELYLSVLDKSKIIKIDNELSILDFYNYSNLENCISVDNIIIYKRKLYLIDSNSSHLYIISKNKTKFKKYLKEGREGKSLVRNPTCINYLNNNIFINDNKNYLIQWFDSQMNFINQIGGKGTSLGKFDLPIFSIFKGDDLLICDKNNDRIINFSIVTKKCSSFIKSKFTKGELRRPSGLAIDSRGFIYVSDRSNNVIQVFDRDLNFLNLIKSPTSIFDRPSSLIIIKDYIAVLQRKSTGSTLTIFKLNIQNFTLELLENFNFDYKLNDPQDMCSSNNNSILIADTLNRKIIEVSFEGKIINEVDLSIISNNKRILIKTIFCRKDGHIFTADFDNCIVFHFDEFLNLINVIDLSRLIKEIKVIRSIYVTNNYLLIGVRGKNQLLKIDFDGNILDNMNKFVWNHPAKIIDDKYGNIIIADKENDRIVKI